MLVPWPGHMLTCNLFAVANLQYTMVYWVNCKQTVNDSYIYLEIQIYLFSSNYTVFQKQMSPFSFFNNSETSINFNKLWHATSWGIIIQIFLILSPRLKTVTTLTCEIWKSYFSKLQQCEYDDVTNAKTTVQKVSKADLRRCSTTNTQNDRVYASASVTVRRRDVSASRLLRVHTSYVQPLCDNVSGRL